MKSQKPLTAQQRLAKLVEKKEAEKRERAKNADGFDICIRVRREGDGILDVTGFECPAQDPREIVAALSMAVTNVIIMSHEKEIPWPEWMHYATGFLSSCLAQSCKSSMESIGLDYDSIQAHLLKHADTMTETTQVAFEKLTRKRNDEAKKTKGESDAN